MATKKVIFLLNIGNYAPELTAMTYPLIERYAKKIDAGIFEINQRKFPEWDLDYEKLQIYELSKALKSDWNIYIDSDAVIHPELPDLTELIPMDTVAHNGSDFANVRWKYDKYFRRDGRHIGSCNWLAIASSWCTDLWRPLDDLTFEEAVANINLSVEEEKGQVKEKDEKGEAVSYWPPVIKKEHLVSDYALSRNIARFGLKHITLNSLWEKHKLGKPNFFFHEYTLPIEEKINRIRDIISPRKWNLL